MKDFVGRFLGRAILLGVLLSLAFAGFSQAATLKVMTTKDSMGKACTLKKCSLRDAVTYAKAGDTVALPASSRPYAVTLGEIKVLQPITITGAGAKSVIKGNGKSRVFEITATPTSASTITVNGVTITGGRATSMPGGGAILVDQDPSAVALNLVLNKVAIVGDSAAVSTGPSTCCGGGGGIYSDGGSVTIEHGTVSNDTAKVTGTTSPTGSVCCDGGGGIYNNASSGSIVVVASRFAHDSFTLTHDFQCCSGGGAIYQDAGVPGTVAISKSELLDNSFTLIGSQAVNPDHSSNCCSGGGAVYQDSDAVTVKHSRLTGNKATVSSGSCCQGGGAFYMDSSDPLTLVSSMLSRNAATVKGPTSTSTDLDTNCCSGGGAAAVFGAVDLLKSTLDHNSSSVRSGDPFEGGGAIQIDSGSSPITSVASTISNNSSLVSPNATFSGGGGVFMDTDSSSGNTYSNSTVSGNTTNAKAHTSGGGGLYFLTPSASGENVLASATIAGNSATSGAGGGAVNAGSKIAGKNTIIALNSAKRSANCAAFSYETDVPVFTDLGFNLTNKPNTCDFTASTDQVVSTSKVKLGPLAKNGGPTETRAELKGSAAIDHGSKAAGCTSASGVIEHTDQRGKPRPDHGESRCDIGAYEYQDKSTA